MNFFRAVARQLLFASGCDIDHIQIIPAYKAHPPSVRAEIGFDLFSRIVRQAFQVAGRGIIMPDVVQMIDQNRIVGIIELQSARIRHPLRVIGF